MVGVHSMTRVLVVVAVRAKVSFVALLCSGWVVLVQYTVFRGAFRKEPQQYFSLFSAIV